MILEKELKKIVSKLMLKEIIQIDYSGFQVTVQVFDDASRVLLSTPVYFGGNYIPDSVRQCIEEKPPFAYGTLQAGLSVNEENYQLNLDFTGDINCLDCEEFTQLIDEFCWLAGKWRDYLDERDRKDLVRIPI